MALKRYLNDDEKFGLNGEEIKLAEKWLKKYKTAGAIQDPEAMKIYEMLLLGSTVMEVHATFPQWPIGQIALTIALRKWMTEREKMVNSVSSTATARMAKSVVDSVNFLTSMLAVANTEHLMEMNKYIKDPQNEPKPSLRIGTLKEYKEILDSLQKLVVGGGNGKKSLLDSITAPDRPQTHMLPEAEEEKDDDAATLMLEVLND
jgi:hypothetical protein